MCVRLKVQARDWRVSTGELSTAELRADRSETGDLDTKQY